MKNLISLQNKLQKLSNKTYFSFWLIYHLLILAIFAVTLFFSHGKINIDADLFNMLPKPILGRALSEADEKLTEMTGQNVFILVTNEDFSKAKIAAETAYEKLKDSDRFKTISLYQDSSNFGEIIKFVKDFRYNLLDDEAIKIISGGSDGDGDGAEVFAENALATAYGAFTLTGLENLETDPFMLTEHNLQNYLSYLQNSTVAMSLKDGVLASKSSENGKWYVMIRGTLSAKGAALASKGNAVVLIHEVCDALEKDGTEFVYSGTPFHSYKSSSNATKEISIISAVSLSVVLVILLLIFKRPQPILFSLLSILISTITAIIATFAFFGKIHILTLVFGTSLIGSCIDYSLHYFISWKANKDFKNGSEIRMHLIKGLGLSLVSTILCYFVLLFAPFNLLKQMSVFSMAGIISTFLTVICIYPFIKVPETGKDIYLLKFMRLPDSYNKKLVGRTAITILFVLSIGTLLIFHNHFKIENNVGTLYKMEGKIAENEKEAQKILNYNPSGWFIVSGKDAETVLQNEEKVTQKLKIVNAGKEKGGFICTSAFIPSIKHQKASIKAAEKLLPFAENQFEALGYDETDAVNFKNDFLKAKENFIEIGKNVPDYIATSISQAWLGEIDGKYYSVVLPTSVTDYDAYMKIADETDDVFFISKTRSMNRDLDKLSYMILSLFVVVYVVLFIVLRFFYTWKQSFKIISVPLLIILFVAAIFSLLHVNLEFFSITGMILVFGLGLDYVIYMLENEKRTLKLQSQGEMSKSEAENASLEPFAIALSFVTTAVSFGSLSLSKFVPVHNIGLSIFIGLVVAYVSTFFYTRADV